MVHPKRLEFMGLSSGTSGVDKFIPFPDEQFANFRLFTNHAFFHAFHALNDATLLAKNILVTSVPTTTLFASRSSHVELPLPPGVQTTNPR